ncbi:collagen binding domain-containing protein, partial [Paenibacillus senegalensis]|uniref:collagen binding domain-containing protein n=1 Tax=Paenibacillus senegalensis TaxID=1465766 RepID=UPI0002895509
MVTKKLNRFTILSFVFLLLFQTVALPAVHSQGAIMNDENPCGDVASPVSSPVIQSVYAADAQWAVPETVYGTNKVTEAVYTPPIVPAFAGPLSGVEIERNIITNVVLKDENHNVINYADNPGTIVSPGDIAHICMAWELPNDHRYPANSTFSFTLPEHFTAYNNVEGDLVFGSSNVGSFVMDKDDLSVVMTFNESITTMSNIKGMLWFGTFFKEELHGNVDQEITFDIKDEEVAKIPVRFEVPDHKEIVKSGITDRGYNAKEITWTVDLNRQLKTLDHAILEDPIDPEIMNQRLIPGSIEVYKLDVQIGGGVNQGDLVDESEYTVTNDPFSIDFGSISEAYRVVFKTEITDGDSTTYRNKAVLKNGSSEPMEAEASVTTSRGAPLAKESTEYDSQTQTITWEIRFNYNEKDIPQALALLEDTFSEEHIFVKESVVVERMAIDENGQASVAEEVDYYTVTETTNGFDLQFTKDIENAYKITYTTKAKDRVFEGNKITNKVSFGDNEKEASRDTRQEILHKSYRELDYKNKTVEWVININRDKYEMKDLEVVDTFPYLGLQLHENTIKVYDNGASPARLLEENTDYTLTLDPNGNGFTIAFNGTINTHHQIVYTTDFRYDLLTDKSRHFTNKVDTTWKDPNDNDAVREKEAVSSFPPDQYTKNNGFKHGAYDAEKKEITWNVGVNYDLKELTNIVITDEIQDNQILLTDTILLYEAILDTESQIVSKGALIESGYSVKFDDDNEKLFTVTIHGTTSKAYWLEFKTSFEREMIKASYKNEAELSSDGRDPVTVDASVSIPNGESYVKKSGKQNDKVIDWRININFGQSYLSNVRIVDEQTGKQILLENSFTLYSTKVAPNGQVTADSELVKGEDYSLHIETKEDGSQTFELVFADADGQPYSIDRPYILEYQSFINARHNDEISNKVTLHGDEITSEDVESEEKIRVFFTGGGGTGSGETGNLEVTKVDADTNEHLEGAVFELYDSSDSFVIKTATTGTDGKVVFTNLLYDDYILKEKSAPEGYVIGIENTNRPVTVDAELTRITIENKKMVRAVELKKLDAETKDELEGAVFSLRDSNGQELSQHTTDADGRIIVGNLEPGTYEFVEITAPAGYELESTPIPFTITENQTSIVTLTKENDIILGDVEVLKVDQYDDSILSGVKFDLLDENEHVLQTGLVTDEAGKFKLNGLRPGTYYLKETEALEHYELPTELFEFTVAKGQTETLQLKLENKMVP